MYTPKGRFSIVSAAVQVAMCSRFGVGEGAKPLKLPKAAVCHSQLSPGSRARILAKLDAANRRLWAIAATNRAASAALATACEPDRADPLYLRNQDNCS
jgi:hypothetical protein